MKKPSIQLYPTRSLKAWKGNARRHTKKQIHKIAESITAFGFTAPILIDDNQTILAGHGRFEAAKFLGLEQVPCVVLEHLTNEQKRAYVIADNRLSDESRWDYAILADELKTIKIADPKLDLRLTGFSLPDIEVILSKKTAHKSEMAKPITTLQGAAKQDAGKPDTSKQDAGEQNFEKQSASQNHEAQHEQTSVQGHDDYHDFLPSLDHQPRCKKGDLWQIGPHRLVCGTLLDRDYTHLLMGRSKATMVIVDPYVTGSIAHNNIEDEYIAYYRALFSSYSEVSHSDSCHMIFSHWTEWHRIVEAAKPIYGGNGKPADVIIWNKGSDEEGALYRSAHRMIFVFKHRTGDQKPPLLIKRSNVWSYKNLITAQPITYEEEEYDIDQRPVAMLCDAISDFSKEGDIILDGFGWTGQSLVAAHKTGRRGFLCEEDPVFCEIILRRAEACTGQSARLIAREPKDQMSSHSDASFEAAGVVL